MKGSGRNISLTSYDDLFSTEETRQADAREQIQQIPLSELHPFKDHPFRVVDDDRMMETVESVKEYGVLVPAIARPLEDGGYEIVAGHRRKRACELAGLDTMPVIVRDLDDDESVIIMVDSNLQRENILPSERAKAYQMKLEAIKHQGARRDLTSSQVATKLRADQVVGAEAGVSKDVVHRYNLTNTIHFTDDGISGTRFDRPGFMAMMADVEAGKIHTICVKDMSRVGRDYLKVGEIMEILRKKGVRLIAVNDGVDSFNGDDDFTPFRNIMNEYYARDTSKKIRSTFAAKGRSGKHVASTTPYGYVKDPLDHNHWLIDEEAAQVVRRIFQLTVDGYGPYQISQILANDKVEIPAVHMARHHAGLSQNRPEAKCRMLRLNCSSTLKPR